jgi:3',5'-cyclic-AMP phosphodiesterase
MNISRRDLLLASGYAAIGLGKLPKPSAGTFRVVFLTDTHIPDQDDAAQRAVRAFAHAQAQKPDLVIFGGDNVMQVDGGQSHEQATAQFDRWKSLVASEIRAPHTSVIGNHDIWWYSGDGHDDVREKKWPVKIFGLDNRYGAVNAGGWRFLLLDVFHRSGCHVDPEQMEWLEREVKDAERPLCLVTHAPLLSVSHFEELGPPKENHWKVPTSWQVGNAVEICRLLRNQPKARLVLSGHMHHVDRCDYYLTTHLNGGAVSGAWWKGSYHEFPPAYLVVDLEPDGQWRHEVVYWETAPPWLPQGSA